MPDLYKECEYCDGVTELTICCNDYIYEEITKEDAIDLKLEIPKRYEKLDNLTLCVTCNTITETYTCHVCHGRGEVLTEYGEKVERIKKNIKSLK